MRLNKPSRLLESSIERPASEYAKLRRWFVEKIAWALTNGMPDRFYARRVPRCPHCGNETRVVLIEYKRPGSDGPTEQQLLRHDELRAVGIEVHWVADLDEAKRLLR